MARIFWSERRLDRAATWFEKALVLDPDQGDSWAWYWNFLAQHGTEVSRPMHILSARPLCADPTCLQDKRRDVLAKCVASEPRHGEVWQSVAKDAKLVASGKVKRVEDVLKMVAERLEQR